MKFGVCVPNYGATFSVEDIKNLAIEAEVLGYHSVWTTDHVLMPRDSGTPYERIVDAISTLAYIAGLTRSVKLGISSLIIAMRNPVVAAKQLGSIDSFSNGRVMLAVGTGWNKKEFNFLGSDFHTRGKRVDESIRLIRSLWRGESEFESKILGIRFEDAVFEPKLKSEHIEIWVGGTSEKSMRRAAEFGDAWHPNAQPLDEFANSVEKFRESSTQARNKDICVRIGLNLQAKESEYIGAQGDKRILLSGDMSGNREILTRLEELGVSQAVLVPNPDGKIPIAQQLKSIKEFSFEFVR